LNRNANAFTVVIISLLLLAPFSPFMNSSAMTFDNSEVSKKTETLAFKPSIRKSALIDQNGNRIADNLDQEIAEKLSGSAAEEFVDVTVLLRNEPTSHVANLFASFGGYLTTSPWTYATYGFAGRITYTGLQLFTNHCPDVLLVEKEAISHSTLAYAATQIGARNYVWNTLALQGDSNSSIAILDSGIDASHPDFSLGYGDQDFSQKIVGWNDQITSASTPFDDNGHGSHCAGLAAGNGFYSVDSSGYATATWGANLGTISDTGTYLISGFMVNCSGPVALKVKWYSTGVGFWQSRLSTLRLFNGDKTLDTASWTQAASVNTPTENAWYDLTYNIAATPTNGYDMYHILMDLNRGTGNLYVTFNASWPYTPPTDGFSAWTGIAPQAKLVGVKVLNNLGSGTSTALINGINWIIANRMTYHITVASLSLGYDSEVTAVDSAVQNLVNSGITTIVSAGNSGEGGNYIYTPASVDEVITVAATNQFDNTASYSSQGGTSRYNGNTTKPDITAPGGSFHAVPLISADSNDGDADGYWTEIQTNDAALMQGTSMSTPIVAGAANIIIQAMGGYESWTWTRSQALLPKMIMLMTATETYPNPREPSSADSPTLERGGKDVHEGYGRLNLNGAIDAITKTYQIGTNISASLGKPPTLTDISVVGEPLVWARNVQLIEGFKYNFTLNVPTDADYDLYLYNSTGTTYGEPAITAKSTTDTTGETEKISIQAPYNGTYYLIVKRATTTTANGNFNLTSTGPVLITLNTPGLPNAPNIVHYTQNNTAKSGTITDYSFSNYVDTSTTLQIDNPVYPSTTQRYKTTEQTSFTINHSITLQIEYTEQFLLTVHTQPESLSPEPTRIPQGEPDPAEGYWYESNTHVTLTAQQIPGLTFDCWIIDETPQEHNTNPIIISTETSHEAIAAYLYEATLQLEAGWNMVSFPVIPDDTSFASIFSGADFYQVVTWTGMSYTTPTNVEAGRGYWVLMLSPTTITLEGTPVKSYEVDLPAGWSMIGGIYDVTVDADDVFPEHYQLVTWTGTSYVTATTIEPGKGYWVLVLEETYIIVDGA
jgi:subtilisin family serine protease